METVQTKWHDTRVGASHADRDSHGKDWREKDSGDRQFEMEKAYSPLTNDPKIDSMIQKLQK